MITHCVGWSIVIIRQEGLYSSFMISDTVELLLIDNRYHYNR